ncbi:hypothetical protein D3C87_1988550 [compost metagenome]
MSGGIGDQMGEAFHGDGVAIPDIVADSLGERNDLRHVSSLGLSDLFVAFVAPRAAGAFLFRMPISADRNARSIILCDI